VTAAEDCFHRAIETAQAQSAKSLACARRPALLGCGLRGKRAESRDLLAPVYGGFTEGFDTADLKDAKSLLDELG
jgi:predicted ATPase